MKKRLLVIDTGGLCKDGSVDLLDVLGWESEVFQDTEQALDRYEKTRGSDEEFDLIMAKVPPHTSEKLEMLKLKGKIKKLLLINQQLFCREIYQSKDLYMVCDIKRAAISLQELSASDALPT